MLFQKKYTAEQLQKLVDEYFASTPMEGQSVTGLALHLDTRRQSLCNWEKDAELGHIVTMAKARIEHAYEMIGVEKGRSFDIFRLKNMGWTDRQEIESKVEARVNGNAAVEIPDYILELINGIGRTQELDKTLRSR